MGVSRYLAAILDLCKLGGFPTGVEFQQIKGTIWVPESSHFNV